MGTDVRRPASPFMCTSCAQCWSNSFPRLSFIFNTNTVGKCFCHSKAMSRLLWNMPFLIQRALMYRFQWNKSEILYCRRFVPHWKQILIRWLFRDCIGKNGVKMLTPFFVRLAMNRHLGYSKKKKTSQFYKPHNFTKIMCIWRHPLSISGMNTELMAK